MYIVKLSINIVKKIIGLTFKYVCLITPLLNNKCFILMYHRISDNERHGVGDSAMFVSKESLDMHISELKRVFEIISLKSNSLFISNKPTCVLTFDDGWEDNYINAYPVLRKHSSNATIFVTINYIDSLKSFWFHHIWYIFDTCNNESCTKKIIDFIQDRVGILLTNFNEESIQDLIGNIKKINPNEIDRIIIDLYEHMGITVYSDRSMLTWDQVREMNREGIDIGSHGLNHYILTNINEKLIIKNEIAESLNILTGKINSPVKYYCYPNGNSNIDIRNIVSTSGYIGAIGTDIGYNTISSDKYNLKRIAVHDEITCTPALLWYRIFQGYIGRAH